MGQGFTLRNYTKGEEIISHDLGLGYKLGEFGSFKVSMDFEGSLTQLARELVADNGRWNGDLVLFVGDYGDAYTVTGIPVAPPDEEENPEWKTLPLSYLREWVQARVTDQVNLAFRRRLWSVFDSPEVERIAPRNESVVL
ncbi:MAG: hypothetical protein EBX09_06460 [Actinobacteria bacterium]|jgi:hypothetical protein|nr:hypothetical protein [Actinomycetota bacterium]NCX76660.1 hypothetical protein [Actinomycetota bacterium]